jgi:copper oxidase (laccase) domain-containing protein
MSFMSPVSLNGQLIQRIAPPDELDGLLDATLFLRGSLMDRSKGNPEQAWAALGGPSTGISLIAPVQVHGTAILDGKRLWSLPSRPRADGILLDSGEVAGSLRFADCLPLMLASRHPRPWALMLHAGFEGTAKGIVSLSLECLEARIHGFRIDKTFAWIGPGIGPCCYTRKKAGDPRTALGLSNLPPASWTDLGETVRFDIPEALRLQLLYSGLDEGRLFRHGICTSCHPGQFYSYRAGDRDARIFFLVRSGPTVHNRPSWWENI